MEYIFTDLPRYVKVTDRSRFSNAVIHDGYVLLFSQDGQSLTAKLPNGSFVNVGGSDSFSFSQVTATASDVLAGKFFHNSSGILVEGTIQTVTAAVNANKIVIPRGFIESDSITIPQADPLTVSGNTVTVPVGYIASQRVAQIAQGGPLVVDGNVVHVPIGYRAQSDSAVIAEGGPVTVEGNVVHIPAGYRAESDSVSVAGGVSIEAGYIDANGNFQPLSFNGTQASDSGSAVSGLQHKIFNTGHEEPDYPSGGGGSSMDFYKCSYVNSNSWGGYKAVFNGSYYQFQSDSTEGLTYSYYFVPEVGNTYAGTTCTYKVTKYNEGLPTNGLILYLPLDTTHSSADTGQPLTMAGNIMFSSIQGVPCAYFNGSSGYTLQGIDLSQFINGFTLSVWVKETKTGNSNILGRRSGYTQSQAVFGIINSQHYMWTADNGSDDILITQELQNTNIRHLLYTYINGTCGIYLNNTLIASGSVSLGDNSGDTKIGLSNYSSNENFEGYIAALRLYNRVLTAAEIAQLASQFTPTA